MASSLANQGKELCKKNSYNDYTVPVSSFQLTNHDNAIASRCKYIA